MRSIEIGVIEKGRRLKMALGGNYWTYDDGSLSQESIDRALADGDLRELSDGSYYSDYYKESYWSDGTRRD